MEKCIPLNGPRLEISKKIIIVIQPTNSKWGAYVVHPPLAVRNEEKYAWLVNSLIATEFDLDQDNNYRIKVKSAKDVEDYTRSFKLGCSSENADANVCGNHGRCQSNLCVCDEGWFGGLCEHPYWHYTPCIKGQGNETIGECICEEGWTGRYCDVDIECHNPVPVCENRGVVTSCSPFAGDFECQCQGAWGGVTCSVCNLTCNSGTANDECTQCECDANHGGAFCEWSFDDYSVVLEILIAYIPDDAMDRFKRFV